MSDYQSKKQERIERYRRRAQNAKKKSEQLHEEASKMASVIPFGQPILVGHHSEKRDRNYRGKIHNKFGRAFEEADKADYWAQRAESAEHSNAISSDDPEAADLLQAKIERLEAKQAMMKAANRIVRKKNLSDEEKIAELVKAFGWKEETAVAVLTPDFAGRVGFPSYKLTNNNANIKRLKQRLSETEKRDGRETTNERHGDIGVTRNAEENRIQLFFDGKPEKEVRTFLKKNGFRWAPSNGCWQRQWNNAGEWAAKHVVEFVNGAGK